MKKDHFRTIRSTLFYHFAWFESLLLFQLDFWLNTQYNTQIDSMHSCCVLPPFILFSASFICSASSVFSDTELFFFSNFYIESAFSFSKQLARCTKKVSQRCCFISYGQPSIGDPFSTQSLIIKATLVSNHGGLTLICLY